MREIRWLRPLPPFSKYFLDTCHFPTLLSAIPVRRTKAPGSGAVCIVDSPKQTSRDSDFERHPGDGKYVLLGVLLLLALWVIVLIGGWRMYLYTVGCFALFMAFINRRELLRRISTAVRKSEARK